MSRGHVVHVASQQKESPSHAVSFQFPMERRQTPSFLLSRYQDLSIGVPLHENVKRSPVKAFAISTRADAIFLSSSSMGTPITPGLPLALPGTTYASSVSSLTSLAFDPASTPSILSSPSVASSKYSTRQATTSNGLTLSTSTTRHPLEFKRATLIPVSPSATMPTTTITTSQVTLTMPITTVTPPSTISLILSSSSSTDTSTTTSDHITRSTSHSPPTPSTSLPSSTSRLSSSTTTFLNITSDPVPIPSVTNVSTTSTYTVPITETITGLAPVTSSTGRTSTITTIRVITSTLQGGRTTVVRSVVESRVLSTSDPVLGSRFSHNTGAIIGVAVSATLGVILSVFAVFFSCARYRSGRDAQLYGRQRRHRRQHRNQKEFAIGSAGAGWFSGMCGRKRLPPIPAGPIFTQPPRSRRRAGLGTGGAPARVNSSTRILGNHTPDDLEEDIEDDEMSWRPPLAELDDQGLGRVEHGGGLMGGIGYAYGQGFGHPYADMHGAFEGGGVALPTPPESGEGQRKSSLGHSQSWGHASSGHGHGHAQAQPQPQVRGMGMESALLPPGSGILLPLADPGTSTMPAVAQYVACGYPGVAGGGVGVRNIGDVGNVGPVELPPAACFGSHTGTWMGTGWEGRPNDAPLVTDEGKQGDGLVGRRTSVIGVGGLVTPRTSEGGDLSGSPTVNRVSVYDATGSGPVLERGSGSVSGTGDGTGPTTRVSRSSTSSRSKSIRDVLGRFRTLSSSTRRNSNGATVLVRPASASAAIGGGTNGGGVGMTRPGYDYGAIMRPQQRRMSLERAIGHYQQHPLNQTQMGDGPGHELKPPPPVVLANHEMGVQYSSASVHPQLHLYLAGPSGERADNGSASPGQGTHGRGVGEVENEANEEESLDTRVVRDKLLDPYFLSPGGNGSSPNIEGASLRDYVDYSRRIGGMVKDHSISTTTLDTVDQDGASASVGTLANPR